MPALLLLATLAACGGGNAVSAYNEGMNAFHEGRLERAREKFDEAVTENPDFSEACLQLSVVKMRLACREAKADHGAEAVRLWRESVADRRRSKALMDDGKFFVADPSAREKLKSDTARVLATLANFEKPSPKGEGIVDALKLMPEESPPSFR